MGLKKFVPISRSKPSNTIAPAKTGVAKITRTEVAIIAQQNRGILNKSMPGIRIDQIVTKKFTPAKIDEVPTNRMLRIQTA